MRARVPLLLLCLCLLLLLVCAKADPEKPKLSWENKEHKHELWDLVVPIVQSNLLESPRLQRGGISGILRRSDRTLRSDKIYDRERDGIHIGEDGQTELV